MPTTHYFSRFLRGALALLLLTTALLTVGCSGGTKRFAYQAGPMWVGYDVPSDWTRGKSSDMSWTRKGAKWYLIRTDWRDLKRARPDIAVTEHLELARSTPDLDTEKRVREISGVLMSLEDWERMVERHIKPSRDAELKQLQLLQARVKSIRQGLKKTPPTEWEAVRSSLDELATDIDKLRPQDEAGERALLLTTLDYFAKIDMSKVTVEQPELEVSCELFTLPTRKGHTKYAVFPMGPDSVYFIEFREIESNKLEEHIKPILESVKIGLFKEEVVSNGPLSQLLAFMPETNYKTRRKLFVLGFFLFCTVLPASVAAASKYPGQRVPEEDTRAYGASVRRAAMWTSDTASWATVSWAAAGVSTACAGATCHILPHGVGA